MYRIRRFRVIQTSTIVAVTYVLAIAIFAIPFAILVFAYSPTNSATTALSVLVGGLLAALLYAAIGWIFTAIACVLYNLAAGWTGGIEVQVEPVRPPAAPPNWGPPGMPSPPTLPPAG
jgi:hypothetical protein